jgi:hypothetical protein
VKSKLEPCLYSKKFRKERIIIAVFVDDFFIFSNSETMTGELKKSLMSKFKIKDLGQLKQCLGIRVKMYENGSITLDQKQFVEYILKKFNMSDCKGADTPIETNLRLEKSEDECKKQQTVALSSTEAEYMAIAEACKEAIYLKNVLSEIASCDYSIVLFNDNQGAQRLTENPLFHKRTKHIDVRHHFVRESVANNLVKIVYLPTSEMPADLLTKGLPSVRHNYFLSKLGIQNIV